MSSYTDNLQSTVNASLQSQLLDQKQTLATYNASVFTLYYAQGATNTAADKLELEQDDLTLAKAPAKEQAVHSSNICNNLVASANQANVYIKQTISNTAVCASNVQIAANAVMRLASNIGGVYSIVNASDFHGPIYNLTQQAYEQINLTAYNAELASQYAMEASTLAAEVSVSTVNDKAKAVKGVMDNLLGITSSEFDSASEIVRAGNVTVAALNAREKLAEGALEDVNVDLYATEAAYNATNNELNLNLLVPPKFVTNNTFTVTFNLLKTPFTFAFDLDAKEVRYPVENYYIMVVKESKKLTFSLNNAETFVTDEEASLYVKVTHFQESPPKKSQIVTKPVYISGSETITITQVKDADGDTLLLGTSYVVFVFAQYYLDYKKKINNFDDYLSAPSLPFVMATQLNIIEASTIEIDVPPADTATPDKPPHKVTHPATISLTFQAKKDDNLVQYRCMFLPDDKSVTKGLLTYGGLRNLEKEIAEMEEITFKYDPLIAEHEAEYNNAINVAALMTTELQRLTAQQTQLNKDIKNSSGETKVELEASLVVVNEAIAKNTAALTAQNNSISTIKKQLDAAVDAKNNDIKAINSKSDSKIGFFFDVTLAEQIAFGNYTVAQKKVIPPAEHTPAETLSKKPDDGPTPEPVDESEIYSVNFGPATTDNFGNLLITGNTYIPVILSIYNGNDVQNLNSFISGLSDYNNTRSFNYYAQATIN